MTASRANDRMQGLPILNGLTPRIKTQIATREDNKMRRLAGAAAVVAIVLLPGCGSGSTAGGVTGDDQSKTIGKSTFADWPLTADSGLLKCAGSGGVGKVTIEVAGQTYAVNGTAKGDKANLDIQPIWANAETAGLKKDIGSLIQEGLRLCK